MQPLHAIEAGFTKYTAVDGIPELKEAIKNKFKRDNGLDYQLNQILVSVGGKQSCYNLCQAFLMPAMKSLFQHLIGFLILIWSYWLTASLLLFHTTPAQRYKINAKQLEEAITPKTKMIFLNSPSNPSGIAYTLEELKALGRSIKKTPSNY